MARLRHHSAYRKTEVITNLEDKVDPTKLLTTAGVKSLANYYLDREQAMYQPKESLQYSYVGIVAISPDGQIQQVSWNVGEGGATTEASKNSEFDLALPSHTERRTLEILRIERQRIRNGGLIND